MKSTVKIDEPFIPICYFCGEETDEEHYCYGCKHYVCSNCSEEDPFGDHDVEDHQPEPDEEEQEESEL